MQPSKPDNRLANTVGQEGGGERGSGQGYTLTQALGRKTQTEDISESGIVGRNVEVLKYVLTVDYPYLVGPGGTCVEWRVGIPVRYLLVQECGSGNTQMETTIRERK